MAGSVLWFSVVCAAVSVLSAVLSIAVLALDQVREHRFAKIWFFLHTITAGLAATYYTKVVSWRSVARLRQYHSNFLWLSRALGVPIMAAHLTETCLVLPNASQVLAGCGIAAFAIGCWSMRWRQLTTDIANCVVMAVLAVLCCLHRNVYGSLWVAFLSLSLVIGTHGSPLTIPPVLASALDTIVSWGTGAGIVDQRSGNTESSAISRSANKDVTICGKHRTISTSANRTISTSANRTISTSANRTISTATNNIVSTKKSRSAIKHAREIEVNAAGYYGNDGSTAFGKSTANSWVEVARIDASHILLALANVSLVMATI